MEYDTDVLIVGGGPAGLATAIAVRDLGLQVVVADGGKPPIDKACGEGLLPDSMATLRRLGISFGAAHGHVLRGIRFEDSRSSFGAKFRGPLGLGVRRDILHHRMVERAQECGVAFSWNTPIAGLCDHGVIARGNKIHARWVIGADGLGSRVRRWCGLQTSAPQKIRFARRQHYRAKPWSDFVEVHWGEEGQAYVTPLGPEEICVALLSKEPNRNADSVLQKFPWLTRKLQRAQLLGAERGAITGTHSLSRVSRGNIALVGDASGTVDAITGEGLSLGFRQAILLADALKAGELAPYEKEHKRLFRRPRFMANLLLLLDRRSGFRRRAFQVLQAAPHLFECMLAYHVGVTRPLELAAASAQFGWRFLNA